MDLSKDPPLIGDYYSLRRPLADEETTDYHSQVVVCWTTPGTISYFYRDSPTQTFSLPRTQFLNNFFKVPTPPLFSEPVCPPPASFFSKIASLWRRFFSRKPTRR